MGRRRKRIENYTRMNTRKSARELSVDLLPRSICRVGVTAVLSDNWGIFGWGWNHVGDGTGEHAEAHAIGRASKQRLPGSTLTVFGKRRKSAGYGGGFVMSFPCPECYRLAVKYHVRRIEYHTKEGWKTLDLGV